MGDSRVLLFVVVLFFKQKTAYEMRISDWSSDGCSSDLRVAADHGFDEIEWHAVIREPGAYFESLHSQLSWHTYADSLTMFSEIMKKGVLFLPEPHYGDRKSTRPNSSH